MEDGSQILGLHGLSRNREGTLVIGEGIVCEGIAFGDAAPKAISNVAVAFHYIMRQIVVNTMWRQVGLGNCTVRACADNPVRAVFSLDKMNFHFGSDAHGRTGHLHHFDELVEEVAAIVGPRRCLGVVLHREGLLAHHPDAFQCMVVQVFVGHAH